ncbi:type II toxin-antitoxin system antitoxin SocA domain-containing protein [uncultured Porphyromonas sp.]|jgi:hypothetical protein|uniref:Panacea domain-containing protein n=1 Tax=uncultured Porphyromonas sp. TaxID=159274 RepID=UPI0026225F91|nr:type II toxin-antitoxin system antitoxin SocA domain-containing protein [uncultured Porphyromonas sp.]
MVYPSRESDIILAKALIEMAGKMSIEMNMTKVQKLLYIAYGAMLAREGKKLLKGRPHAWPYGPVFPLIREALMDEDFTKIAGGTYSEELDDDVKSLFEAVLKTFGGYSATSLSEWSHREGSPWWKVVERDGRTWNTVIPDEYIVPYFVKSVLKPSDATNK